MAQNIREKFDVLYRETLAHLGQQAKQSVATLEAIAPKKTMCRGFEDLGHDLVKQLSSAARHEPAGERKLISLALIASLARDVVDRVIAARVTPNILERTERWCDALYEFLSGELPETYFFPDDYFVKDYRFVQAMTVPCGAQVVDLEESIGLRTAISLMRVRGVYTAWDLFRSSWFRVHTESRYLDEFSEEGWTKCYREIAKLLLLHPHARGMAATSWFYDPQLESISPRLAYLSALPMQFGALRVPHGTTDFDIRSATATSSTRRALYESGKFTPVCHSILWKREDLCHWAADTAGSQN